MISRTKFGTTVVPLEDIPQRVFQSEWVTESVLLHPSRFRRASARGAWRSWAVLAHSEDEIIAVMVVQQARQPNVTAVFDPAKVAPTLFELTDPQSYLLLGGVTDLVSGTAVAPGSSTARAALVSAAKEEAVRRGLIPAALYVRDQELDAFIELGAAERVSQACVIRLAGGDEGYLAALRGKQRRTVIGDRRRIAESALRSEVLPAIKAVSLSALVVNVKRRHGVPDHSRLVRMRLVEWAAEPVGERLAFVVSGTTGPLAVTYACRTTERLEIYEIGLVDDAEHRHDAYTEGLVHAPVRFCIERAIPEIHLGLDTVKTKIRRGAVATPVWAVGPHRS